MKHSVKGRKLNRNRKQREALFTGLMANLIANGQIKTTQAKAKAIKGQIEKLITTAKKQSLGSRRSLSQTFGRRGEVNVLTNKIAKMTAKRQSGYTRTISLGERRGDNTQMVRLELIDFEKAAIKESAEKAKPVSVKAKTKTAVKTAPAKPKKTAEKKEEV